MTMSAIMAGLVPILWSTGAGSGVMQRIAVPMVGGMGRHHSDPAGDPGDLCDRQRLADVAQNRGSAGRGEAALDEPRRVRQEATL